MGLCLVDLLAHVMVYDLGFSMVVMMDSNLVTKKETHSEYNLVPLME